MDLGTRNTLLYDFMHCMTAVSLEMSDEPNNGSVTVEPLVPDHGDNDDELYG